MPFIKRRESPPAAAENADSPLASHIAALLSPDAENRWRAARTLGGVPAAVPALASALAAETIPRVRDAMMTALMRVGNAASVRTLLPYLRSQDAGQRASAIEALQAIPEAILPFMPSLLADQDTDLRILATELARNMPAKDATRVLCALLKDEKHPNVCAAAIDVLSEVGTREAVDALEACAARFSGTPFLPFAAATAIARICGTLGE